MSCKIIEMHHWTDSALGHYLLEWEQQRFDEAVADIFGYHSLAAGLADARPANQPHAPPLAGAGVPGAGRLVPARRTGREVAADSPRWAPAFYADFRALPLADACWTC
jgi:hypothetical protein